MKFMVMVKASKDSEAGVMPDTKLLAAMGKYNEELVKAGILLAGEGLHPSEQAIEWLKRCPNPMPGDSEIELRQVFEAEDFGAALTPELRAQEERLRKTSARKK